MVLSTDLVVTSRTHRGSAKQKLCTQDVLRPDIIKAPGDFAAWTSARVLR